ncbi:MAG TPA: hypothetical protein VFP52_00785 [Myxococcales bacterium]|nr:hypothetical protein [Myxococcales bacterium]
MKSVVLMLLAFACGAPPEQPARAPATAKAAVERLPRRSELPCFPCHSQVVFEKGPNFAHASIGHRNAGHCHLCHMGMGHHGRDIDRSACLSCHPDGPPEPELPGTSDTKDK